MPIDLDELMNKAPPDFVVISHNHYDHLDLSTVKAIGDRCKWFVPKGLGSWFQSAGVSNVIELDWW